VQSYKIYYIDCDTFPNSLPDGEPFAEQPEASLHGLLKQPQARIKAKW